MFLSRFHSSFPYATMMRKSSKNKLPHNSLQLAVQVEQIFGTNKTFAALSDHIMFGIPRQLNNFCSEAMNAFVDKSQTDSICIARVVRQTKNAA